MNDLFLPLLPDVFSVLIALMPISGNVLYRIFCREREITLSERRTIDFLILGQAALLAPLPLLLKSAIFASSNSGIYSIGLFFLFLAYLCVVISLVLMGPSKFFAKPRFLQYLFVYYPVVVAIVGSIIGFFSLRK